MDVSIRGLVLFGALIVAACSASAELTVPCETASECEDGNPCTDDVCDAGVCRHEAQPDGVAGEQIPGDCQVTHCEEGAARMEADPGDVPNDLNTCTDDLCDASGAPQNIALPDGSDCQNSIGNPGVCMGGVCEVSCVAGGPVGQCDDQQPCTIDSCNEAMGVCVHEPIGDTLSPNNVSQDCKVLLCQDGVETEINDDTDLPIDGNECTEDICFDGIASHQPHPPGILCDQNGGHVCNGDQFDPQCVECVVPFDCEAIAPSNNCRSWQCNANYTCVEVLAPNGTPLPVGAQTPMDCQTLVCDGNGNSISQVEPTDVFVDGFECTDDICNGNAPQNVPLPPNSPCGINGTQVCDGLGMCI